MKSEEGKWEVNPTISVVPKYHSVELPLRYLLLEGEDRNDLCGVYEMTSYHKNRKCVWQHVKDEDYSIQWQDDAQVDL